MRPTRVTIDLCALRHNLQQVRRVAPQSRIMAAIKANGYGHGLERVAAALQGEGVDAFGVASLEEAERLRRAGIDTPITLLEGFFHPDELPMIADQRLELVLHHPQQIAQLYHHRFDDPQPVWLKLDTGMHRLGIAPEQVPAQWRALQQHPQLAPLGQMTHLACADESGDAVTERQLALFRQLTAELDGAKSAANSAGILGWPASHGDVVRPGIMLYGVSPFVAGRAVDHGLRPVMNFRSSLIAVNRVRKGERIGYGGTWVCPEDMPVGVVAAGYGDGYPRHAVNGTPVLVNGQPVPLVGRVSMDMLTVDLRQQPRARIGDPVVLWGEGLPAEAVAEAAGTIAYELFCGVTQRVPFREVA
ncbi:MAG: alanine racemase [Pseudomonadota bacterium]